MTPGVAVLAVLVALAVWTAAPRGRIDGHGTRARRVLTAPPGRSGPTPDGPPRQGPSAGREGPSPSEVADALALLALAYRSGLPTTDVLDAVAEHGPEGARRDLRQVGAALRWGAGDEEAWGSVGRRWAGAARAVVLAGAAGTAPGPLLTSAAEDLRLDDEQSLEARAARLPVRLVVPTGLVLLPAFCLVTVVPLVAALARRVLGDA